jgi:hypothetical protein
VNYNQNSLLDLTFTISGSGAYPSSSNKHRLVNLKTGKVVKAADVFKRESLGTIATMVNKAMQAEVKQAIANGDKEGADLREQLTNQRFQSKHLDSFMIRDYVSVRLRLSPCDSSAATLWQILSQLQPVKGTP